MSGMAEVDRAFGEYMREHREAGGADPRVYLERVGDEHRAELAALIDGYLVRAPRREFDREAFEQSNAAEVADSLHRELFGDDR